MYAVTSRAQSARGLLARTRALASSASAPVVKRAAWPAGSGEVGVASGGSGGGGSGSSSGGGGSFFSGLISSIAIGGGLLAAFELVRLGLAWPQPCEDMLTAARLDARLVELLGGAPVRLAHPAWDGETSERLINVRLPLRGEGPRRAVLYGRAVRTSVEQPWVMLQCEVHVAPLEGSAAAAAEVFDLLKLPAKRSPPPL